MKLQMNSKRHTLVMLCGSTDCGSSFDLSFKPNGVMISCSAFPREIPASASTMAQTVAILMSADKFD
jgi:hypothetical protein